MCWSKQTRYDYKFKIKHMDRWMSDIYKLEKERERENT